MDPGAYINLVITSNASQLKSEKKFPIDITLENLKRKLVLITGCDERLMKVELKDQNGNHLNYLTDDSKCLMDYGLKDPAFLHITDPSITDGMFDDAAAAAAADRADVAYAYTDEDYAKREDSALVWKKRNQLGRFRKVDENEAKLVEEANQKALLAEKMKAESLAVGSRCEIRSPSQPCRRGVIEYIGTTQFKKGYWVGVRLDEPVGINNGSVAGVTYFKCPEKYGAFVKPQYVEAGDFPELGIDELDEI